MRQYVFLDECGVTTDLLRRYGRSPCGTRLRDHAPFGHWDTHTVVAALRVDGLGAPAVFNGPIDTPSFLAYIEQVLVPTLRAGDRRSQARLGETSVNADVGRARRRDLTHGRAHVGESCMAARSFSPLRGVGKT